MCRTASFLLSALLAVALFSGCGDNIAFTPGDPDAGALPDADTTPDAMVVLYGTCGVTVRDDDGYPVAGAAAVFNAPDGTLLGLEATDVAGSASREDCQTNTMITIIFEEQIPDGFRGEPVAGSSPTSGRVKKVNLPNVDSTSERGVLCATAAAGIPCFPGPIFDAGRTAYTFAGVQPGDTVSVGNPPPMDGPVVGVFVEVPAIPDDVDINTDSVEIQSGMCGSSDGTAGETRLINLDHYCTAGSDPTTRDFLVTISGQDEFSNTVYGWAMAKGVVVSDGMTLSGLTWTFGDRNEAKVSFANVPFDPDWAKLRFVEPVDGVDFNSDVEEGVEYLFGQASETWSATPPGFADQNIFVSYIERNNSDLWDRRRVRVSMAPPTDAATIDLGQAHLPGVAGVLVGAIDPTRLDINFVVNGNFAVIDGAVVRLSWYREIIRDWDPIGPGPDVAPPEPLEALYLTETRWYIVAPGNLGTSASLPVLPEQFADWAPTSDSDFDEPNLALFDADYADYSDHLTGGIFHPVQVMCAEKSIARPSGDGQNRSATNRERRDCRLDERAYPFPRDDR